VEEGYAIIEDRRSVVRFTSSKQVLSSLAAWERPSPSGALKNEVPLSLKSKPIPGLKTPIHF